MLLDNLKIHRLISTCLKGLPITHLKDAKQKTSVTMTVQDTCHLAYMHLTSLAFWKGHLWMALRGLAL